MKLISVRGRVCEKKESNRDKEKVDMKTWRDMKTWDERHVYIQLPLTQSHPFLHTQRIDRRNTSPIHHAFFREHEVN